MTVDERIAHLISLLKSGQRVTRKDLEIKWECTAITVHRTIARARNQGIPIEPGGGRYHLGEYTRIDLPGISLGADELAALLGLAHWLEVLGSGVLKTRLDPIRKRLELDLDRLGLSLGDWRERIRLLPMQFRLVDPELLVGVVHATLRRRQVEFHFKGGRDTVFRVRTVSPQSLVRYRDNWYLDAWDPSCSELRCFALSRMRRFQVLRKAAHEVDRPMLECHFAESYGIFAGRARKVAKLIFTGEAARFVAEERWHPKQRMSLLADGRLRLDLPCGEIRELARDIMRYADEVEVLGPEELWKTVDGMVRRAAARRPGGMPIP